MLLLVVFTYIVTVGVLLNHKRIKDNEAIAEARYNLPHQPTLRAVGNPDVDLGASSVHTNLKDNGNGDGGVVS